MKDTILMGMSGSGKTTLIQALLGEEMRYAKTQTVERRLRFIDTPGEYLERRSLYRALIVTAADAELIGLVQAVGSGVSWLPPAFATTFAKPVFGIVSKTDLAADPGEVEHAREALVRAGADPVFEISAVSGAGMATLGQFLEVAS
ncbi:MAG: EutP/PduV family microcompartment system protein [Propionibacteriaceae bacterium]|jgi:ethanolamine utilization protein EutP|nr:EutP/PduV family microcompartment system protein [Propionibacteriaceae bacterium]